MFSGPVTYLCLLLPACSLAFIHVKSDYGQCGLKTVKGLSDFDYTEFANQTWQYYATPNIGFYRHFVDSVSLSSTKENNNTYIASVTVTLKNGIKITPSLQEVDMGNGVAFETLLVNGKPTDYTFILTFYAYKKNEYAQFYICANYGKSGADDARAILVPPGKTLTKEQLAEIKSNDLEQTFTGTTFQLPRKKQLS